MHKPPRVSKRNVNLSQITAVIWKILSHYGYMITWIIWTPGIRSWSGFNVVFCYYHTKKNQFTFFYLCEFTQIQDNELVVTLPLTFPRKGFIRVTENRTEALRLRRRFDDSACAPTNERIERLKSVSVLPRVIDLEVIAWQVIAGELQKPTEIFPSKVSVHYTYIVSGESTDLLSLLPSYLPSNNYFSDFPSFCSSEISHWVNIHGGTHVWRDRNVQQTALR